MSNVAVFLHAIFGLSSNWNKLHTIREQQKPVRLQSSFYVITSGYHQDMSHKYLKNQQGRLILVPVTVEITRQRNSL